MTSSLKSQTAFPATDDTLLVPWAATGMLDADDARLFAASLACDPALADDLAAARAERDAVVAMAASLGRPSPRALALLFEAIDAETAGANVTRLRVRRPRAAPMTARPMPKTGSLR